MVLFNFKHRSPEFGAGRRYGEISINAKWLKDNVEVVGAKGIG